jgi:ribonuclease R
MPAPIAEQQILDIFRVQSDKSLTLKELGRLLGIGSDARAFLRKKVRLLVDKGHLRPLPLKRFALTHTNDLIEGVVRRNARGFGWFIADDATVDDSFISPPSMAGLFDGDRILAAVYASPKGFDAQVQRVVERGRERITGVYRLRGKAKMVQPDSSIYDEPILIAEKGLSKVKGLFPGVLVEVEMTTYPTEIAMAAGEVVAVLGMPGDLKVEIQKCISESGVPYEFPQEVLDEATSSAGPIDAKARSGRRDLRKLPLCTVDGVTAKDFDDAVFAKREKDNIRVYVAIADVAHYVPETSLLDSHAFERSTSVYYPGRCIPMLPEQLSNGMCSLRPDEDRLCMVAEVVLGVGGAVKETQFYEAVMCSRQRLTYGQVQAFFDHEPEAIETIDDVLRMSLVILRDAAQRLGKARRRRGTIDLDVPEPVIQLDEDLNPVAIKPHPRVEAHRMIEELMIMANEAVARYFEKSKFDAVYRIHEPPNPEKLEVLFSYVRRLGVQLLDVNVEETRSLQTTLQNISKAMKNHTAKDTVMNLILRAMMQARYSSVNLGHFGLASTAYLHFTSPIRRYPDLIVHRLLKNSLKKSPSEVATSEKLESFSQHCSDLERRAVKLEREINALHTVWYMQDKVGEVFSGKVVSCADFGLFVRLSEHYVDGLVHISTLGAGPIEKDEYGLGLRNPRSGFQVRVGDPVVVEVAQVNVGKKQIDFILREPKPSTGSQPSEKPESRKKGPSKRSSASAIKRKKSTGWSPLDESEKEVTPQNERSSQKKKTSRKKGSSKKKKKGKASKRR